jgi:hypothetical protein
MKQNKTLLFVATVAMIAGAAALLFRLHTKQNLGAPAVRTRALAGERRLEVLLPERVLDYQSEWVAPQKIELDTLPSDTSFGHRRYQAPDHFELNVGVVLMGSDRTSLHKPEFCLEGQGWRVNQAATEGDRVHVDKPVPYDLPVTKLVGSRELTQDGQVVSARGVYVYWFVAQNELTAQHWQRMWWMARDLMQTGVLQRWAYVSCFSACRPGQEEVVFERIKKFIAASAPEFQLTPGPGTAVASAGK